MPDQDSKPSAFKVVQPNIPGVPKPVPRKAASMKYGGALPFRGLMLAIGGVLLVGIAAAAWFSRPPQKAPTEAAAAAAPAKPASASAPAVASIPVGPGEVGTTDEIAEVWSAKHFEFMNALTHERVPAMVVHLPDGMYWGFSLREPFGHCYLEYLTDYRVLQNKYNFTADHPMVADPCNLGVFDLLRYGPGITGVVRGEMVQGSGLRPPMAIEIKVEGHKLIAVRSE